MKEQCVIILSAFVRVCVCVCVLCTEADESGSQDQRRQILGADNVHTELPSSENADRRAVLLEHMPALFLLSLSF